MKHFILSIALIGSAGAAPALAQRTTPANSLARTEAALAAADVNKDGRLDATEARTIPLTAEDFAAQDLDKDGFWSRDEFVLHYRQRLISGAQTVGADLEAEAARIQALRRAKLVEEARKKAQEGATEAGKTPGADSRAGPAANADDPITIRLRNALDDLEKRAAAGQTTREDFQRLRNLLITRARAAATGGSGSEAGGDAGLQSEIYQKMSQSLDRIEKRAAEGLYSREEYQELREMIVRRARAIESGQTGPAGQPPPTTDVASIQAGLQNALDQLEKRVAGGGASREDFQRVRDLLVARARAAANPGGAANAGGDASSGSETYLKMIQSLERLEKMAAEGRYSREEYQQLREMIVRRARVIDTSAATPPGGPAAARQKAAESESTGGSKAPRDPRADPAPVAPRDPPPPPVRPRPVGENPAGETAKRPAPPPAPAPAPPPQRPADKDKEKEKPPPQRPPNAPERPKGER